MILEEITAPSTKIVFDILDELFLDVFPCVDVRFRRGRKCYTFRLAIVYRSTGVIVCLLFIVLDIHWIYDLNFVTSWVRWVKVVNFIVSHPIFPVVALILRLSHFILLGAILLLIHDECFAVGR